MASNFCEICKNFQEMPDGNASPRKKFIQPTCYDHVVDFQKYCKNIELETKNEKCRNNLTAETTKLTNFTIDTKGIDNALKNFTPEQLNDFKEQIRTSIFDDVDDMNTNKRKYEKNPNLKNMNLNDCCKRSPIKCPVSACSQIVGLTSILSHFLRDHQKRELLPSYEELKVNENFTLKFSPKIFEEIDKVLCLAIIIYAGENIDKLPVDQGLCLQNAFLPEKYQKFSQHLPVLILGTKTYLKYMLNEEELDKDFFEDSEDIEIYILWAATVDVTKKIHCTLTAYDNKGINSRSSIIQIRSLKSSQNPKEFLQQETNYLILNCGEVNLLTKELENVHLEMNIKQYE